MSDLAEVANNTIDHIANGVQKIADAVSTMAPGAWTYAVKVQRTEGLCDLIIGVTILLLAFVIWGWMWRLTKDWKDDDREPSRAFSTVVLVAFSAMMLFGEVKPGILHAVNPEYYAAVKVAEMVSGK